MGTKLLNNFRDGMKALLQDTAGILLDTIANPLAPTLAAGVAGALNGTYKYCVTFIFQRGETPAGAEATIAVTNTKVDLPNIPTAPVGYGRPVCVGRGIYRTAVGGASGSEKLVTIIPDNTTTSLIGENLADGALGVAVPTAALMNDYYEAFYRALANYSGTKPLKTTKAVTADGTSQFLLNATNAPGFDEYYDQALKVEYPISSAGQPPNMLDEDEFQMYRTPTGLYLRIFRPIPSGDTVWITYNQNHTVDGSASTVSDNDYDMLVRLGTAECCDQLSLHYSQAAEKSFVQSDQAVYINKAREYANRSKELRSYVDLRIPTRAMLA